MMPVSTRFANNHDVPLLSEMPPYLKCAHNQLCYTEDVLVAESRERILGAISIGSKNISLVYGDWEDDFDLCLESLLKEVSGSWISKLYVFPKYRHQGIGTKLVEKALESLEQKNTTEVYVGIYVENEFKDISIHIFEKNGFVKIGSCVCPLDNGYCRGTLLRKKLVSNNQRQ